MVAITAPPNTLASDRSRAITPSSGNGSTLVPEGSLEAESCHNPGTVTSPAQGSLWAPALLLWPPGRRCDVGEGRVALGQPARRGSEDAHARGESRYPPPPPYPGSVHASPASVDREGQALGTGSGLPDSAERGREGRRVASDGV